jgi:hypothetical protein
MAETVGINTPNPNDIKPADAKIIHARVMVRRAILAP